MPMFRPVPSRERVGLKRKWLSQYRRLTLFAERADRSSPRDAPATRKQVDAAASGGDLGRRVDATGHLLCFDLRLPDDRERQ